VETGSSDLSGACITSSDPPEKSGFTAPESLEKPGLESFYVETGIAV